MEKKEVLEDYGWCQVLKDKEKYFLNYDGGGVAIEMKTIQVSKSEAEMALKSQEDAEKVVRKKMIEKKTEKSGKEKSFWDKLGF